MLKITESAMLLVCSLGEPVAAVAVDRDCADIVEEKLESYGLADKAIRRDRGRRRSHRDLLRGIRRADARCTAYRPESGETSRACRRKSSHVFSRRSDLRDRFTRQLS